ncbi:hypothetical protein BBBGCB_BBBGCB_02255, partial [Dysosmobacter welbionis]
DQDHRRGHRGAGHGHPQPGGHGGVLPGRRTERHSGGQRRDAGPHCRCYPGWL